MKFIVSPHNHTPPFIILYSQPRPVTPLECRSSKTRMIHRMRSSSNTISPSSKVMDAQTPPFYNSTYTQQYRKTHIQHPNSKIKAIPTSKNHRHLPIHFIYVILILYVV